MQETNPPLLGQWLYNIDKNSYSCFNKYCTTRSIVYE